MSTPPGPLARAQPWHRRGFILYLLLIIAPMIGLAWLGLRSVRDQQRALSTLTASNAQLEAERFARTLEKRTFDLAAVVLGDPDARAAAAQVGSTDSPGGTSHPFAAPAQRHPIVSDFFVIRGTEILYPAVRSPLRMEPAAILDLEPEATRSSLRERLRWAMETESLDLARAAAAYRQVFATARTPAVQALSLSRQARCLDQLGRHPEARASYLRLAVEYADLIDSVGRPYGLEAALAAHHLAPLSGDHREFMERVYDALLADRWDLSVDQAVHYERALRPPGTDPAGAAKGPLFRRVALAETLNQHFQHHGPLRTGTIHPLSVATPGSRLQAFYTSLDDRSGRPLILGFAASLPWIRAELTTAATGHGAMFPISENPADGGITFATLFPLWRVHAVQRTPPPYGIGAYAALVGGAIVILVLGVILLVRDVAREREIVRLRTELVHGISHDLKTPLAVIRLYADTLRKSPATAVDAHTRYAEIISGESQRLGHLIENVLTASQIDRGAKQYQIEFGEVAPVVHHLVEAYRPFLEQRGFTLEVLEENDLPTVRLDADAAGEAVLNLIENAVKYSADEKHIIIRMRRVTEGVAVDVEDRGIGVPEQDVTRVFEQFYRRESEVGGYGIGLFLVRHILDAHGGRVELRSGLGRGSCFTLIFASAEGCGREDIASPSLRAGSLSDGA